MSDQLPSSNHQPAQHQRLWTPWRMRYVGGDRSETGCIFCNRLGSNDDRASLILQRGEHAFVIMNLFPYNTGHVMIVPNEHLPTPEALDDATTVEMARLIPRTLQALRAALNPAGFNLGINVGADAGAGIATHLHQHVVPRWQGDANFMPILAGTMVLPELIPATYAKIRAELGRATATDVTIVAVDAGRASLLVTSTDGSLSLPRVPLGDAPVWRSASSFLSTLGTQVTLAGWAGAAGVCDSGPIALAYEISADLSGPATFHWLELSDVSTQLAPHEAALVGSAINAPSSTS